MLEVINNTHTGVITTIDDAGNINANGTVFSQTGGFGRPSTNAIILASNSMVQGSFGYQTRNAYTSPGGYGGNCFNLFWTSVMTLFVDNVSLGTIMTTSDYRTKKDVIELPGMWETVKKLRPIKYTQADFSPPAHLDHVASMEALNAETERKNKSLKEGEIPTEPVLVPESPMFKADDIERWGFIAHELQETLTPTASSGSKDSPNEIQSPQWPPVVAALTKALQEAMARIEALEARL